MMIIVVMLVLVMMVKAIMMLLVMGISDQTDQIRRLVGGFVFVFAFVFVFVFAFVFVFVFKTKITWSRFLGKTGGWKGLGNPWTCLYSRLK